MPTSYIPSPIIIADFSVSSSYAETASYFSGSISNAVSASYAETASYALNGGGGGSTDTSSLLTTASFSNPNLTFTKGDGSTFNVPLTTLVATSSSYASTASYVSNAISSSFALTASYVNSLVQNVLITGSVYISSISSSEERVLTTVSGGLVTSSAQVLIQAYIDPLGTIAGYLNSTSSWDINGDYSGSVISGTYQGQKHYNSNYFFEAVDDNVWIRLIRG